MRRTKIIATLGPATDSPEMLGKLLDAGVNVFRLNMSHAKHDWVRRVVKDIRSAAQERKASAGILLDTQGPAIRTGDLPAPVELNVGDHVTIYTGDHKPVQGISTSINYPDFPRDVAVGNILVIDNGEMKWKVVATNETQVVCEVLTAGKLGNRRHINLPNVRVSLPALTEKDILDVGLGLEVGVDYIALSFVREADDILLLRSYFKGHRHQPQIVAKIEHQFAVNNFEAIARESDAIMVARGDLGVECPYEELPIIQRRIVKSCLRTGRPVIVATHMLESMIENPLPTRAEITDVANAVFEQADAIMLSGETTVGKHPLACIEVMDTIARRIERSGGANYHQGAHLTSPRQKLVKSAVQLADDLNARALVVFTRRGHMARYAGWMRPKQTPIFAFTEDWAHADALSLIRGVEPRVIPFNLQEPEKTAEAAIQQLLNSGKLKSGDVVVMVTTVAAHDRLVDAVKLRHID